MFLKRLLFEKLEWRDGPGRCEGMDCPPSRSGIVVETCLEREEVWEASSPLTHFHTLSPVRVLSLHRTHSRGSRKPNHSGNQIPEKVTMWVSRLGQCVSSCCIILDREKGIHERINLCLSFFHGGGEGGEGGFQPRKTQLQKIGLLTRIYLHGIE